MLDTEYILEFAKVREVNSPAKAWDAAGWDFYVPTDLNITDFTKNWKIYVNENLVKKSDITSPAFLVKNKNDNKELWIKFYFDTKTNMISYINCNSGLPIYPKYNEWIENKDTVVKSIDLDFGEKILIPSGIHVKLPKNVFLNAANKSGIASKRGLVVGAQTIDIDYQGEIHIQLMNVCNNIAIINAGDKIVQFIAYFQPYMKEVKEYNSIDELYKNIESERGSGGFGSSDKNDIKEETKTTEKQEEKLPENKKSKANKSKGK